MTEQLQLRRGTATQVAAFTGAQGEIVVDTTNNRAVVNDGSTAGGWPAAKLSRGHHQHANGGVGRRLHGADDRSQRRLHRADRGARRHLPAASAYPTGTRLVVFDESGACSATTDDHARARRARHDRRRDQRRHLDAYGFSRCKSDGVEQMDDRRPGPERPRGVGIGTAIDPNNPLSVYGPSALFNGVNFNVDVNKAAAGDTASFIFEDDFSGRAQIGLCGNDNFSFKVSPNGSSWVTAIALDATTGVATFANTRTAVPDAAYSALITDRLIAYTALTAARTVTLPAASAYPAGQGLTIVDESGACSAALTITVARAGSDVINGAASAVVDSAYGHVTLVSNGGAKWTIV